MDRERAMAEFPGWAMVPVSRPVRITDEPEWKDEEPKPEWKLPVSDRMKEFWKKHAVLIACCAFLPLWTAGSCGITAAIVRNNTEVEVTERVKHEMLGNMQSYLDQQEQQRMAESLLTGEASRQAAMDADADWLARLAGPYATKRMQLTVIWNALVRVANPDYPDTVEGVVNQASQWMFYKPDNPIRADVRELAMEQLKLFREGRYPAGLSNSFVYGEWSATDYVLRDRWEKDSRTCYWRMPE